MRSEAAATCTGPDRPTGGALTVGSIREYGRGGGLARSPRPGAASPMQQFDGNTLRQEQARTLATPRIRYGLLARVLFVGMDLFYGRRRTFSKFKVRADRRVLPGLGAGRLRGDDAHRA